LKANVHSFNDIHVDYFEEKLSAYSGERREYDSKKAAERLREWQKELSEDETAFDYEEFQDMIYAAESCSSKDEWAHEYVNGKFYDFISDLDCDYWEWIYNIGDKMPIRIIGYLVGLKMASEQLKTISVTS